MKREITISMFQRGPGAKQSQEMLPNFYYFGERGMLDCNMYLLRDGINLCLIDAGNGLSLPDLIAAMDELGLNIQNVSHIILTHDHLDHVMGLYPLLETLTNPPKILAHPYCADMLEEGNEQRIVPGMFGISAKTFKLTVTPLPNITRLTEAKEFTFGEFTFQILHSPGHSQGSICLYDGSHKILLSGDVVFPQGSFGRYDFPGCSLKDLIRSIQRLTELDVNLLCAGHMAPVLQQGTRHIALSARNITQMRM